MCKLWKTPANDGSIRLCARENLGINRAVFPLRGAKSFISLCIFRQTRFDSCFFPVSHREKTSVSAKKPVIFEVVRAVGRKYSQLAHAVYTRLWKKLGFGGKSDLRKEGGRFSTDFSTKGSKMWKIKRIRQKTVSPDGLYSEKSYDIIGSKE